MINDGVKLHGKLSDYTQQVKWRWEFATKPQNPNMFQSDPV